MIPTTAGRLEYDWKEVSNETALETGSDTLVQQSFKEEVDINTIVRRFGITGNMPFGRDGGMYGDFTGITDFQSAVDLVNDTQTRFMTLPAQLREKFSNDPAAIVRFAQSSSKEEFDALFNNPGPPAQPAISAPVAIPNVATTVVP